MLNLRETVWINPDRIPCGEAVKSCSLTMEDVLDASRRLERFAPYFEKAFPETAATHGIIESPLKRIPEMKKALEALSEVETAEVSHGGRRRSPGICGPSWTATWRSPVPSRPGAASMRC